MKVRLVTSYKLWSFIIFSCCVLQQNFSQEQSVKNSNEFWNSVRFGGGLGLSFGDGFFSGTIAPSSIYQFNDYLATGIGLNATYAKRKNFYKSTILGGSIIVLVNPIQNIQLSSEFEELHVSRDFDENLVTNPDDDYWCPALFFGIGYRSGKLTLGIRYDVLYDEEKSIYADPWMPFVRLYF